ncbi:MAG: hypothetical protein JKX97_01170 [Candidatus Lindowbacteria bacterium]|nr:hypothetical protein [Candidatus Lindowbacteria bacterium]
MPSAAPAGKSALYVEVSARKPEDLPENYKEKVFQNLIEAGIIDDVSRIEVCKETWLDSAYGIHDLQRTPALDIIRPFLESIGIMPIGRYGRWAYTSMGEALSEGKAAGEKLKDELSV